MLFVPETQLGALDVVHDISCHGIAVSPDVPGPQIGLQGVGRQNMIYQTGLIRQGLVTGVTVASGQGLQPRDQDRVGIDERPRVVVDLNRLTDGHSRRHLRTHCHARQENSGGIRTERVFCLVIPRGVQKMVLHVVLPRGGIFIRNARPPRFLRQAGRWIAVGPEHNLGALDQSPGQRDYLGH